MNPTTIQIETLQPPVNQLDSNQLHDLYSQLTSRDIGRESFGKRIEYIVSNKEQKQFVARSAGQIIGALTFSLKIIPTRDTGYIDDVVVAKGFRRKGVGELLVEPIIEVADETGLQLQLTNNPQRNNANFWTKLGFVLKDTGFYERTPTIN